MFEGLRPDVQYKPVDTQGRQGAEETIVGYMQKSNLDVCIPGPNALVGRVCSTLLLD